MKRWKQNQLRKKVRLKKKPNSIIVLRNRIEPLVALGFKPAPGCFQHTKQTVFIGGYNEYNRCHG